MVSVLYYSILFLATTCYVQVSGSHIHGRIELQSLSSPIPRLVGFNITINPSSYQPIVVESFNRQATPTLTTTLTISNSPAVFTLKPYNSAIELTTFLKTSSGQVFSYACFPTSTQVAGATKTTCIKDSKTVLANLGSISPTPSAVAKTTMTSSISSVKSQTANTRSLNPSSSIVSSSSALIFTASAFSASGPASPNAVSSPSSLTTASSSAARLPSTTSTSNSARFAGSPSSSNPQTLTRSASKTSSHVQVDKTLTIGSLTVTADPSGVHLGSQTVKPGSAITIGSETLSLLTGGGVDINGSPLSSVTSTSLTSQSWTTVSDSSTTGLYGIITLPMYKSLTTPTIITTSYVESSTSTYGPIFVGPGGIVLQSWPPGDIDSGGFIDIPDPIKPSSSGLKCPWILEWLCGSDHTSSTDDGSDVDPADKPNSDPEDDPNKDNSSSKESATQSTSSKSSCTQSQTVTDCEVTCSPTVLSGKSTTTTTCFTTSCSMVEACSTSGVTSTTTITSDECGTGTASACPTYTTGSEWIYPDITIDTAALNSLMSSIENADASILNAIDSYYSSQSSQGTNTRFSTTRSQSITSNAARSSSPTSDTSALSSSVSLTSGPATSAIIFSASSPSASGSYASTSSTSNAATTTTPIICENYGGPDVATPYCQCSTTTEGQTFFATISVPAAGQCYQYTSFPSTVTPTTAPIICENYGGPDVATPYCQCSTTTDDQIFFATTSLPATGQCYDYTGFPSKVSPTTSTSSISTTTYTSPPMPTQTKGNDKGSSLCSSLGGACKVAYQGYVDDFLYTAYTAYTATNEGTALNTIFGGFAESGCSAIFKCDSDKDYSVGKTGAQIKQAVEYMFENDSVKECGSTYLSTGCHITLNGCSDCEYSVPCGAVPSGEDWDCY